MSRTTRRDFPTAPAGSATRRLLILAAVAATAYALDVISKVIVASRLADRPPVTVIPHVLDLELTRNPGAAFGMAGGATILFTLVALGVVDRDRSVRPTAWGRPPGRWCSACCLAVRWAT